MNQMNTSTQRVLEQLLTFGFKVTVRDFQETTRTAADAAAQVGCSIGQIVKSLIFKGQITNLPFLILVSGSNRVDENHVSGILGEKILRADPEFVRLHTGFSIGGVPPIGYPNPIASSMDEDLLQYQVIWAAAGTPHTVFEISPLDLLRITSARVIKV